MKTKINKRSEVKFETTKDFLTTHRNEVLKCLKNAYWSKNYDLKVLAKDYFEFINNNSNWTNNLTSVLKKKHVKNVIQLSVNSFVSQYNANFIVNHAAKDDFDIERRNAQWNTKSL